MSEQRQTQAYKEALCSVESQTGCLRGGEKKKKAFGAFPSMREKGTPQTSVQAMHSSSLFNKLD